MCKIGCHRWYIGGFSTPVWGRPERRCMECEKRQFRTPSPGGWVTYVTSDGRKVKCV